MMLQRVRKGEALKATHHNAVVEALGGPTVAVSSMDGPIVGGHGNALHIRARSPRGFLGRIEGSGPAGEADRTYAQYWVRELYEPSASGAYDSGLELAPMAYTEGSGYGRWPVATNLVERRDAVAANDTHFLPIGQRVTVFTILDNQDPPVPRQVFEAPLPAVRSAVALEDYDSGPSPSVWCRFVEGWNADQPVGDGSFQIDLPHTDSEYPSVWEDKIIGVSVDGDGAVVGTVNTMDHALGDIIYMDGTAPTDIRRNWKLIDPGKYAVAYGEGSDYADYNTASDTLGYTWHGQDTSGENNHPTHLPHKHNIDDTGSHYHGVTLTTINVCSAPTGTPKDVVSDVSVDGESIIWNFDTGNEKVTCDGSTYDGSLVHDGMFNSNGVNHTHGDTDNRPPSIVRFRVQRVRNATAGVEA